MNINKVYELVFTTDDIIMAAAMRNEQEMVMLMSSGGVVTHRIKDRDGTFLFSVKNDIGYEDGGFDPLAKSTIYTLDGIVAVVNDYKTHGYVHYPDHYRALHLWRKDYYARISMFPIALFKDENGVPHLIYGEAWNHIQIMNLDTRQILTASKSLIEENAEEQHIEFYKHYPEDNKLPWPTPYNYFYGKLLLSPDRKRFLSAGWVWGSSDAYTVYDIARFTESNRISYLSIGGWEHENRAVCWIDDTTIAIAYHPVIDGEKPAAEASYCELHCYRIMEDTAVIEKKVPVADPDIFKSNLQYSKAMNAFISFSPTSGLVVISNEGAVLFKNKDLKITGFHEETGLLLAIEDKTISVYKLIP